MRKLESLIAQGEKLILSLIAGIALVVAVLVLVLDPILGLDSIRDSIPALSLFLLSSLVLVLLARERFFGEYAKMKTMGIEAVYTGRNDPRQLPEYLEILNSASKELFIVGITLKDIPRQHLSLLLEKTQRGCSVELLMLSPVYWRNTKPVLDPIANSLGQDLKPNFQLAIMTIRALAMNIANQAKNSHSNVQFMVKFYDETPSLSLTAADALSGSGRMRVEFAPHNEPQTYFRPMMDLSRSGENDLCSQFYQIYQKLFAASQLYLELVDGRIRLNHEADKVISDIIDPENWTTS